MKVVEINHGAIAEHPKSLNAQSSEALNLKPEALHRPKAKAASSAYNAMGFGATTRLQVQHHAHPRTCQCCLPKHKSRLDNPRRTSWHRAAQPSNLDHTKHQLFMESCMSWVTRKP